MLIGYARVSTPEQDLTPQLGALGEVGCERTLNAANTMALPLEQKIGLAVSNYTGSN